MTSFTLPAIAAGAIATAALVLAGAAGAAPSGALDASHTVGQLQARGFDVIVNKVGTAPGAMDDIVTTVTAMTVFVDVAC